ncbi:MMPL family transporter [Bacillus paralicheniformis]|uniref:MMPL family transporter n=1 Tax=Bacillus paralicheniformis TaxID=1648923 RepID=UPI002E24CF22|nr:MMPL family transporter [Bacillus paralicheniformis]MED1218250.1 MMPL family transporter [Bacillus paralicheniformis]
MRTIIKARWIIAALWIAMAAVLFITAPDMGQLTKEKGQIAVPEGYPSSYANKLLEQMSKDGDTDKSVVVVFQDKQLLPNREAALKKAITILEKDSSLHVSDITSYFDAEEDIQKQLLSKDRTTLLVPVTFDANKISAADFKAKVNEKLKPLKLDYEMTGQPLIDDDVITSSQEGLKKTEYITVGFILIVLILVFRSAVAPFVPLLAVALSYLVSQSVVAYLVEYADFPLSTFTQIFMVAIMFGIGTDYCILLLSRFKEELAHGKDKIEAILTTYKTAGKTVLFSGFAVLIGFTCIGFAEFQLYKSAVAVAVGVAVLILALLTIVPFFMAVLGKVLFWPVRGNIGHPQSKLWETAGRFAFSKPLISLLIVAAVAVPPILMYKGTLSYNSLDEIGDQYESVSAFNTISDKFGPGESLPVTVVLKTSDALDTNDGLIAIEKISRAIEQTNGVSKVRSATRPVGKGLSDLYVKTQANELNKGLESGNKGLKKIKDGLAEASKSIADQKPQIEASGKGINQLIKGTESIKAGISDVEANMRKLKDGTDQSKEGVARAKKEIQAAKKQLTAQVDQLNGQIENYKEISKVLKAALSQAESAQGITADVQKMIEQTNQNFKNLESEIPEVKENPSYLAIKGSYTELASAIKQGSQKAAVYTKQAANAKKQLEAADAFIAKAQEEQKVYTSKIDALINGLGQIEKGLEETSKGQGQLADSLPKLESGAGDVAEGQKQMKEKVGEFAGQLDQLTKGLNSSVDGLEKISSGLMGAGDYLDQLKNASDQEMSGWFVPKEVLKNKQFQQVFNSYMSDDRHITTIDVILEGNPYGNGAIANVKDIEASVKRALPDTHLNDASFGVGGVSSINADLKQLSDQDFSNTVIYMMIGIFLILVLLFRSIVMPVYLVGSLILTYFASIGITEFIFTAFFGYPGLNWAVPFFGFVILMALGVDYSIFLMERFNEYRGTDIKTAMMESMKNMGSVIISAAVILAGTFAAMLPSGVLSLLQIATLILTGLLLYAFVMLPLFVPVMVRIFGSANWFPFKRKE